MKPARTGKTFAALVAVSVLTFTANRVFAGSAGFSTIIDNGPSSNRVDIMFLGDGYTAEEIGTTYVSHIDAMLTHMFNEGEDPFPRYAKFFNVHRIDVVSQESGADVPPEGIFRNTALDATYYHDDSNARALYINSAKANEIRHNSMIDAAMSVDMQLVTVNDSRYGGAAGAYAVFAGGHPRGPEIALHEMGHSFADLADEYGGSATVYRGSEPQEANVTALPSGEKWADWIGYDQPGIGEISVYEGAAYHDSGLFRPSETSKMRALGRPFDAVSREKIILDLYDLVDPLDGWLGNDHILSDSDYLWVDVIDPDVIDVEWFVDNELIRGAGGETFDIGELALTAGTHTITARAFDSTDWVRIDRNSLEQTVNWIVQVQPPPPVPEPTTLGLVAAGAFGWMGRFRFPSIAARRRGSRGHPMLCC